MPSRPFPSRWIGRLEAKAGYAGFYLLLTGNRETIIARMRHFFLPAMILLSASPSLAERTALGIFSQWGAFRENGRCFAMAEPDRVARTREQKPFAAVGYWPSRGVRGQLHFRLGREKRQGSALLLRIDDRTFQLVGGGDNAWAPDARTDAAIVTAMRGGVAMTIETRAGNGARIRDSYRLRGAATAIDAAAIGCAGKKP